MALLNKAQILAAPIPSVDVDVPEWGGTVRIRGLSGRSRMLIFDAMVLNERDIEEWKEADAADQAASLEPQRQDVTIITLIHVIVGDNGQPLFTMDDYPAFQELSFDTQARLYRAFEGLRSPTSPEGQKKG